MRAGLLPLRVTSRPIQHFQAAVFRAWQIRVATDICKKQGFGEEYLFGMFGSHQLRISSHVREARYNAFACCVIWDGGLERFPSQLIMAPPQVVSVVFTECFP